MVPFTDPVSKPARLWGLERQVLDIALVHVHSKMDVLVYLDMKGGDATVLTGCFRDDLFWGEPFLNA